MKKPKAEISSQANVYPWHGIAIKSVTKTINAKIFAIKPKCLDRNTVNKDFA